MHVNYMLHKNKNDHLLKTSPQYSMHNYTCNYYADTHGKFKVACTSLVGVGHFQFCLLMRNHNRGLNSTVSMATHACHVMCT